MVDITGLRNPYDYANPVRADEYFAGRGLELATIDYVLGQAGTTRPVGYLALYGRRAAGKTSLLNMTEKLAADRGYLAVRVNLVPANADPARFFATVYEELIGAVAEACELAGPDGRRITPRVVRRIVEGGLVSDDFPLEFPENLHHAVTGGPLSEMALRNDLRYLSKVAGRPVALLIDEAQLIADRPDVLSMLRTLGMRLEGYVLVLAGTTELVARINEVFDFLLRQFEFIKVERFVETADVVQCMTRPLEAIGLTAEGCFGNSIENVAGDLIPLTDGNPYEIQLFCHVMFTRWQTGAADRMDLTTKTIDDVQAILDVGTRHADRPLVDAVRRMSDEELLALNVWCSSLEEATVDQIRFACRVSGLIELSAEVLDRHLDRFVRDGLIELVDNKVRLTGDAAEHIYARLSTVQRLGTRAPMLIRRTNFTYLLAGELTDLLHDQVLGGVRWLLRTCCPGMRPEKLRQGVRDLIEFADEPSYTVEYLHEAALESGMPEGLHLTTVECSYGETTATRWVCRGIADDFDINAHPAFRAARQRIAELGGTLHAERTTIPLKPMAEMVDWLVDRFADAEARHHMAHRHGSVALETYGAGDITSTFAHLDAAFRLSAQCQWQPANNLAYLKLVVGDYPAARDWASRAVPLSETSDQRALSRYNAGVANALEGEWTTARTLLADAAADLAGRSPLEEDLTTSYLMIPTFDDHVGVHEANDVRLTDAITRARDVVELAERLERLRGSA